MSTFIELIKEGKVKTAFGKKKAAIATIQAQLLKIDKLDRESPNARVFQKVETSADRALAELEAASKSLNLLLIVQNPNISEDKEYIKECSNDADLELALYNDIDKYINILTAKGIDYPPDVAPQADSGNLAGILSALVKAQTDNVKAQSDSASQSADQYAKTIEALTKHGTSSPKATQPFYTPKNNDTDFQTYRDFIQRFQFFVLKCTKPVKLQWLQSSVKGDASLMIKHLTLTDANYDLALGKLEKRYSNPDSIKHSLLQTVLNFKCEANPKFTKALGAVTGFTNALDELRTTHELNTGDKMRDEILREILFYGLPIPLRQGLIEVCKKNYPSLDEMLSNFEDVVIKLNLLDPSNSSNSSKSVNKEPNSTTSDSSDITTFNVNHSKPKIYKCMFCNQNHQFWRCPSVKDENARLNIIKSKFSKNCLKCGFFHPHYSKCHKMSVCQDKNCSKKEFHCRVFCPKFCEELVNVQAIKNVNVTPDLIHTVNRECKSVALPTAIFSAKNSSALNLPLDQRNISTLVDACAQRTLITKETVDRLGFEVIATEKACLIGYGQKRPTNTVFKIVKVLVGLPYSNTVVQINAYVVDKINKVHMLGISNVAKRIHRKGTLLADWRLLNSKSDIIDLDLLVGADFYWHLVNPYKLPIERAGMWLTPDRFGRYFIFGKIPGSSKVNKNQNVNYVSIQHINYDAPNLREHIRTECQILDDSELVDDCNAFNVVKELNNFDALGFQINSREDEDNEALKTFKSNMYIDNDSKQYVVGFPWVNNIPPTAEDLESNYGIVLARFKDTMKSLDKNPDKLQQYKETHDKEAEMDFIERVPLNELYDRNVFKHYINHFPVFKQDSATSKCRRVFDASLHKRGKACLNDKMLKGSQLTPHILNVLLRIRIIKNLFTLDISKAFLRLVLKLSDRNFTCFFMRKNITEPRSSVELWRFKSVLFGATSSPFMLNCTVADILNSNDFPYDLEVFVDNLFVLDSKGDNMIQAAEQLIDIFERSSMPLHEFASNNVSANDYFKSKNLLTKESKIKILGMIWEFNSDVLIVKEPLFDMDDITKRTLLSNIARIYDPIGFLSPVVIQGRLLVQEAMECDFNWDNKLPSEFADRWTTIVELLKEALAIPIPRWIGLDFTGKLSLHSFTDSSDKCIGTVIYLVSQKSSVFISSKAKVCPLKMTHFTVPRKELTAMSLGSKHIIFVSNALSKYINIDSHHIWSDSTLSLTWCSVNKPHKELFIRARVDDIQQKVAKHNIKLHYIINSQNPADMLTKDTGKKLDDPLWTKGPELLKSPEMWRVYKPTKDNIDAIPLFCGNINVQEVSEHFPNAENFNCLNELYLKTVETHPKIKVTGEKATKLAETLWIKHIQSRHYADIIEFLLELQGHNLRSIDGKKLVRAKKLIAPSLCLNLHLTLDSEGIIRIKTSLGNCPNLQYDQKFPILLPAKSPFTRLIISYNHISSGHMSINYTRAKIRNMFWIPKDSPAIKTVLNKCQVCREQRGQRYHVPDSPDLPNYRFDVVNPWKVTYLDMTGHYYIKDKDGNAEKVYFIVFVCAATGSGHIEIAMQASAEAFANSFERFCSKNGVPERILSDQGSNFKAYSNDLNTASREITINRYLVGKKITWEFLPIGDPHFNGYCERSLGILKSIMKKSVKNKLLTLDQLMTVASYAQAVFNERPLCVMDNGDPNVVPLTPNSLVYGRNLRQFVHGSEDSGEIDPEFLVSSKRCEVMHKKLRSTLASVQKTWISEYLGFLARKDQFRQMNAPYTKSVLLPEVNDWVLLKDNSRDLRLGKILELVRSDDGETRKVLLKTNNSEGLYPITNLRLLERHNKPIVNVEDHLVKSVRPKRKAATVALSNIKDMSK